MSTKSQPKQTIKSTTIKSVENAFEFYLSVIENKMCVSLCAYNLVTSEVFVTQFLDCSTFRVTSSTILRFAPKALGSLQSNQNSVFFKQVETELLGNTVLTYFIPLKALTLKKDLSQFASKVKSLKDLETCYSVLLYLVHNEALQNLPISYYDIEEVLVFDLQTTLSLDVMQLSKLFSPITNGGKRLLKANLLQPFSTIDNIQLRNDNIRTLIFKSNDDDAINPLKQHLQKFKSVDALATSLFNKNIKLQEQLQQICKIYNFQKDAIILGNFLNSQDLNQVMGQDFNAIIMSPQFKTIKTSIEICINTNESQNTFDDDTLYFIMINEKSNSLRQNRLKFITARQEVNALFDRYRSCFCVNLKCKKLKQNDTTINCLKSGYIFELSLNEAIRNNVNELDLKRLIETEGDYISFIDKTNKKYNILTEKLKDLNIQINDCVNNILTETQIQVGLLYENMQQNCSWILKLNCWISQLDVALAITDYQKEQTNSKQQIIFPNFGDSFQLMEGAYLHNNLDRKTLNVSIFERYLNVAYDHQGCLTEQLKLFGQFVILAQIGSPVPCSLFTLRLMSSLLTHFQQQTVQNLAERQSSFTAEIQSLTNVLTPDLTNTLILCDSLAISSSHESNVAFSLSFLEAIHSKIFFGIFGSSNSDIMQIADLVDCNLMLSTSLSIESINQIELERILDDEFNLDYKLKFLTKLQNTFEFPKQFCLIFENNFNKSDIYNQ